MPKYAMPLFAAVLAVALIAGCQQEPATEAGSTEATEAGGAEAAAVDPAAARQAVDEFGAAWETAALANDGAALAALYAEDAVILAPGAPLMRGRAEFEPGFTGMLGATPFTAIDIVTEGVEVSASGDLAYAYGTFTSTNTVDGQPFEDTGKWTSIHENRDGQWVTVLDTWNSSASPGGEDASIP